MLKIVFLIGVSIALFLVVWPIALRAGRAIARGTKGAFGDLENDVETVEYTESEEGETDALESTKKPKWRSGGDGMG